MNEHKSVPNIRFKGFEDEWKAVKINYIVNIKAGGDLEKNKLLKDGKYPVIGNTLKNNGIIGYTNTFKIDAPAVTVTGRGEIGKAFYQPIPFTPVVRLLALVPKNENIDMKFLSNEIENLNFFSESTGVPQLTAPELGTYKVGLTECNEQQKIGNLFFKLDKLLDLQQQKIDKLELLKKALLQKLFPRHDAQIPEFRFKGSKDDWEKLRVEKIVKYSNSSYILKNLKQKKEGRSYPVYDATGRKYYSYSFDMCKKYIAIIKDGSNIGKVKLLPARTSVLSTMGYLVANNSDLVFDYYLFENLNFQKYKVGSGIPHIYFSDYKRQSEFVPQLSEQQKIGSLLSKVDQLIELENKKLYNLQQVKKCLLQNMFVE